MPGDPPRHRVLIGAADPADGAALGRRLTDWGYEVESHAEGSSVLGRLKATDAPGIALLDFDLPGMEWAETCRQISHPAHVSLARIPWVTRIPSIPSTTWIIAMHRPGHGPSGPSGTLTGICDTLAKPVDEWELRLRLRIAQRMRELEHSAGPARVAALHDSLTGLWNREALLGLFSQETERAQRMHTPLAVILIDLDNFTERNLEFGYKACDSILRQLAARLRRQLRCYDTFGRSGEDEFLALLPGCGLEEANTMAERLRIQVMPEPFLVQAGFVSVRASFGAAESGGRAPLLVLREAERALAAAKRGGRDCVRRFRREMLLSSPCSALTRARVANQPPSTLTSAEERF